MKAYLIVSHGDLAKGMKMSVEMIAGAREELFSVGLYPEEGPEALAAKLDDLHTSLEAYDEVFVFIDLMGGSPGTAAFTKFIADPKFHFITGVNFPMVLTCVLTEGISVADTIAAGQEGIVDLRAAFADMDEEDE